MVFTTKFTGGTAGGEQYFLDAAADPSPSATPEPASLMLLGTGLLGAAAWRRRQRNRGRAQGR
jgi:PEP-CTERM motif